MSLENRMSLDDWLNNGWIKPHRTSSQEIRELLDAVHHDLENARSRISADWRFVIAYTAALRLCSILLFASGYRAERSQKHYRTISALPLILGPGMKNLSDYLDKCRTRRNEVTYETVGSVAESEVQELVSEVEYLAQEVRTWLAAEYPDLLERD